MLQIRTELSNGSFCIVANLLIVVTYQTHSKKPPMKHYIIENHKTKTVKQIAADLGTTKYEVRKVLKAHGLTPYTPDKNAEKAEHIEFVKQNHKRMNGAEMAREINKSQFYVWSILQSLNIQKRVKKETTRTDGIFNVSNINWMLGFDY